MFPNHRIYNFTIAVTMYINIAIRAPLVIRVLSWRRFVMTEIMKVSTSIVTNTGFHYFIIGTAYLSPTI